MFLESFAKNLMLSWLCSFWLQFAFQHHFPGLMSIQQLPQRCSYVVR